ncbi:MAG: ABC transporter permease [Verrucomicrobiaceae bacterium]|nr:ABC transporter permease [Verrucomicrobiaceae bacterium]
MRSWIEHYGMGLVLLALAAGFSVATIQEQAISGVEAAISLAAEVPEGTPAVLIAVAAGQDDAVFASELEIQLKQRGIATARAAGSSPRDARMELEKHPEVQVAACSSSAAKWLIWQNFPKIRVMAPKQGRWPSFLLRSNLLNIANQIAVIAIVAIGMTMVIISGAIDLSVGSLIALAAVIATRLIRDYFGGVEASALGMISSGTGAVAACAVVGLLNGLAVTKFQLPAFIVTLATMLMASGGAYLLAAHQSIYQVPESFVWLGRASLGSLPVAVILMLLLYGFAHLFMRHTALGRQMYAVGGNAHAAHLSGVSVARVQTFAFIICGALAGLGGVILASQLKGGSPTYGQMYELNVIAAVVVGGASLTGGSGRMFGTLIGAFIIAVIQNGMNLLNIESATQKIVLGGIILLAVLLDRLKLWKRA